MISKPENKLNYYYLLSLVGAFILIILVVLEEKPIDYKKLQINMNIIGTLLILICIFGISLTIKPNWLRFFFRRIEKNGNIELSKKNPKILIAPKRLGHHPLCQNFSKHVIYFNRKPYCTGCLGLTLGALSTIFFVCLFIIYQIVLSKIILYLLMSTGFLIIILNFLEFNEKRRNPVQHLIFNFLLVIGFFFIIIASIQLTMILLLGIIAIMLSLMWLDTRIQLSISHHEKICKDCTNRNCIEKM